MQETIGKLIKQVERGIWDVPEDQFDRVVEKIKSITNEKELDWWRGWMMTEFPQNRPTE